MVKITQKRLKELLKKLEGLDWCFFSGLAVRLYTGNREIGDLDILIRKKDIYDFASELNCEVERRKLKKDGFTVNDYGFDTKFKGMKVEATSGFPHKRMEEGTIEKILKNKIKTKFLGQEVFVEPIEELIVHKGKMFREKDKKDLQSLRKEEYDKGFLKELVRDWGHKEKIMENLKEAGFKIR